MAHYLTNNEKFHIFSKSPVLSSMAVSQAVNKSGHTVSTNDVWADDVPWFTEVADEAGAITRAADARYNDLILWGSDIYVRKGDKTNGASTGTTFAELWEKHTDLTEARAYALGSVTTQTPTNIVTKTVELKNASDKVVLKYHVGKQIDLLTTANNANVASTWAARMFIDGKVVDQFVSPTDKVFAGNPSTGYTTLVYTATAAGNKYGFVAEGEADGDFVNNAFAGIVQFNTSRNDTHKFAASVFEYVGDKLDSTVAKLSAAVFGSNPGGSDQPTDLVTQVNQNTAALTTLNGDVNTNGSIAQKIDTAINGLGDVAVKSDITITDIKVQQGSGAAESLTITDKSVTIEIPEVPAADVTEDGAVTTDGFTKTADVTNLAKAAIKAALADTTEGSLGDKIGDVETIANQAKTTADSAVQSITRATDSSELITVTDGTNATISLSTEVATKTDAANAASEAIVSSLTDTTTAGSIGKAIDDAKKDAIDNAKVTITQGTGITVTPSGTASTSFTVAVDGTIATAQSVTDVAGRVTSIENSLSGTGTDTIGGKIAAAQKAAEDAQSTADSKVSSVTGPTTGLITVTGDKAVTITVSDTIATKGEVSAAQSAAEGKVTALQSTEIAQQSVSGAGITVTLDGTVGTPTLTGSVTTATYIAATETAAGSWSNETETYVAKASDVKAAISDAVKAITFPDVTTSSDAQTVGVTASGHVVSVVTADYTKAVYDENGKVTTQGSWVDGTKDYLVTGDVVRNFVGDETAKTLEAAKAYSNGLHTTSVTYYVTDILPTVPSGEEEDYKGRIYLVLTGIDGVEAADGSRIEYMYVQENGVWGWEQIGTTTADLDNYITKEDIAVVTTTITAAKTSADKKLASITNDGDSRVIIGEATADGDEKSISIKLADTVAIKSDITSAIDAIDVGVKSVNVADNSALVGTSVTTTDGAVTIKTDGVVENAEIPANTVRVENGLCYNGEGAVIAPITTEKIKTISSIPATLTTWIGDMPIWTGGNLSAATNLTTFLADMSSVSTNTSIGGKLDADSVESILYTIGEVSSGTLTLGVSSDGKTAIAEFLGVYEEVASYSYKGWTISVTVNA